MCHHFRGEFIPWWLLYPPVVAYGIYLSIKHRSITLMTAANPGIYTGGAFGESKFELSRELYRGSPDFVAKTGVIEGSSLSQRLDAFKNNLSTLHIDFPVVLKPDIGQGGLAVEVVRGVEQATNYLQRFTNKTLVQEYVCGPYEAGIYYFRFPDQLHGRIMDITDKQFPTVRGDGEHSVESLIMSNSRTRLFARQYIEQLGARAEWILPRGEHIRICERGNWVQGCIFLDGTRLWSPALEKKIDDISRKLDGFFIGRYDLRYGSEDDLLSGHAFKIVELNGITALPTSFKDPDTTVWRAWGLLCKVMSLLYVIGAKNRSRGHPPMSCIDFLMAFIDAKRQMGFLSHG